MSDSMKFVRINKPASTGNSCWICLTHSHPEGFVEIVKPNPRVEGGFGSPALCVGCVWEMARIVGCFDPQQVARLEGVCEEVQDGAETLRRELERTKASMVVPLAEVIDFVAAKHAKELRQAEKPKASA